MENFGAPVLADVDFNSDGTLKQSGKQVIKFYPKKRLAFRAKFLKNADGSDKLNKDGEKILDMDKKTGLPHKEAYEEVVDMINVVTKGDTNVLDDVANELHKRQFYRQWKFYKEGRAPTGNPIEDFDFFQPSTIMELHMIGVHVIQQVATMSDLECTQLKDQSGYEIRDIAEQWVRINSPQGQSAKASRLEMENATLKRQLEEALSTKGRSRRADPIVPVEEDMGEPEPAIATMELTPAELKAGPKGRKRKV